MVDETPEAPGAFREAPSEARRIRLATPEEIPELVRLINAAYEIERFFVVGDRTNADTVLRLMRTGAFVVLGDERSGVAACAYLEMRDSGRAYFGMLSVDPARQGHGLGRLLIEDVEARARRAGATAMDIRVVNLREELFPFYRRLGYVEDGTEPCDDPRAIRPFHFVRMTKTL